MLLLSWSLLRMCTTNLRPVAGGVQPALKHAMCKGAGILAAAAAILQTAGHSAGHTHTNTCIGLQNPPGPLHLHWLGPHTCKRAEADTRARGKETAQLPAASLLTLRNSGHAVPEYRYLLGHRRLAFSPGWAKGHCKGQQQQSQNHQ
jgi:hypothetical protein